jgi:CRISPR/Cas system CSM-associated protein Csm2 small subunit
MPKIYSELSEKLTDEKQKEFKKFFNFVDSLISFFVVSPLVVGFW